jgi:NAD(P)-dependent dehydrogenase (short-subunit alcohol dehydrogenase family)
MQDRTVVITGATSGIGEVAAVELAKMGARIVFTARDPLRAEKTLTRLKLANSRVAHSAHMADLSAIAGMKAAAAAISADAPKIDVLIDNAGAMFGAREETADGLEMTFALNHLSYFVLTNLLLNNLRAAGAGRIVCTSSMAHRSAKINFDNLQAKKGFAGFQVYSRSKLCNILFVRELARRLHGEAVTANALHPGFVASRFGDNVDGLFRAGFSIAKKMGAISPEEGAKTIIYLASSPKAAGKSGLYFVKSTPATPSPEALNDADAKKLWEISAQLSGVDFR